MFAFMCVRWDSKPVTDCYETSPKTWRSRCPIPPSDSKFCLRKRGAHVQARFELDIKLLHQSSCKIVVGTPEVRDDCLRTSNKKRPNQSCRSFLTVDLAGSSVTG